MTQNLYLSTKKSITNWIYTLAQQADVPPEIFDFDSVADEEDIPQQDHMGPIEFYLDVDTTLGEVGFKLAVCTYNDPQIQRLNTLINLLVNNLDGKSTTIPILDTDTADEIGKMSRTATYMVNPVVRLQSRTRPFQTISLVFKLTKTF